MEPSYYAGENRTERQRAADKLRPGRPTSDSTKYSTIHLRLRRRRGPASRYRCALRCSPKCKGAAREWAQIHGSPGVSLRDYIAACASCHKLYDGIGHWNQTPEGRARASAAAFKREAAKRLKRGLS